MSTQAATDVQDEEDGYDEEDTPQLADQDLPSLQVLSKGSSVDRKASAPPTYIPLAPKETKWCSRRLWYDDCCTQVRLLLPEDDALALWRGQLRAHVESQGARSWHNSLVGDDRVLVSLAARSKRELCEALQWLGELAPQYRPLTWRLLLVERAQAESPRFRFWHRCELCPRHVELELTGSAAQLAWDVCALVAALPDVALAPEHAVPDLQPLLVKHTRSFPRRGPLVIAPPRRSRSRSPGARVRTRSRSRSRSPLRDHPRLPASCAQRGPPLPPVSMQAPTPGGRSAPPLSSSLYSSSSSSASSFSSSSSPVVPLSASVNFVTSNRQEPSSAPPATWHPGGPGDPGGSTRQGPRAFWGASPPSYGWPGPSVPSAYSAWSTVSPDPYFDPRLGSGPRPTVLYASSLDSRYFHPDGQPRTGPPVALVPFG